MYRITYLDSNNCEQLFWVEAQDKQDAERLFRDSHTDWEVSAITQIVQKHK